MTALVLQLVQPLLAVAAVLILAYWCSRAVGRHWGQTGTERRLRVLEQVPCGREMRLLLVEWAGKQLLIGAAPSGMTLLAEGKEEQPKNSEPGSDAGEDMVSVFRGESVRKLLERFPEKKNKKGESEHG